MYPTCCMMADNVRRFCSSVKIISMGLVCVPSDRVRLVHAGRRSWGWGLDALKYVGVSEYVLTPPLKRHTIPNIVNVWLDGLRIKTIGYYGTAITAVNNRTNSIFFQRICIVNFYSVSMSSCAYVLQDVSARTGQSRWVDADVSDECRPFCGHHVRLTDTQRRLRLLHH